MYCRNLTVLPRVASSARISSPVTLQGCSDGTVRHSRTDVTGTQGCRRLFIGMQHAAAPGWPLRAVTSYNGWFGRRSVKELEISQYWLLSESPLQTDLSPMTQLQVTCHSAEKADQTLCTPHVSEWLLQARFTHNRGRPACC